MQMLGSPRKSSNGFTLVEVLVVLVFLGLVGGLAVPNLQKLYLSVERRGQLETVVSEINALGDSAYSEGAGFELASSEGELTKSNGLTIALPDGWEAEIIQSIVYLNSGACQGGEIVIREDQELLLSVTLESPHCQIRHE